jgi:alpha-L-rhamnosidase
MCGSGALLADDIYAGATYDARLETPGWTAPGFNFSSGTWGNAVRIAEPGGALAPAVAQPVEVTNTLAPCALWESTPGVFVFDFCQNAAGYGAFNAQNVAPATATQTTLTSTLCTPHDPKPTVRLTLPAPTTPGTVITIRHAEAVMHPPYGPKDGTLYYGNLRSAEATDTYTTRGDAAGEVFEPLFTWHGFRYISVTGLPFAPTLTGGTVTGLYFRSNAPLTGSLAFPASANTLNQLAHAIVWTQAANIIGNPSDCPQRDERMGWTCVKRAQRCARLLRRNCDPLTRNPTRAPRPQPTEGTRRS